MVEMGDQWEGSEGGRRFSRGAFVFDAISSGKPQGHAIPIMNRYRPEACTPGASKT